MTSFPPITILICILSLMLFFSGKINHLAYLSFISLIFLRAYLDPFSTRIRPDQIVTLSFILIILIKTIILQQKIHFNKRFDKPLVFALYLIPASILANKIASGALVFPASKIGFGSTVDSYKNALVPLEPTFALVTQNLYVIFPIIAYYYLRDLDHKVLEKCIIYFVYSVAFLSLWNICNIIGLIIFNNSFLSDATKFLIGREGALGNTSGLGILRIGGFVGEPSRYAYVALPAFGYVMGRSMTDITNRKKWYFLGIIYILGLVVSISTTGFVGACLFLFVYSFYNFKKKVFIYFIVLLVIMVFLGASVFSDYFAVFLKYNIGKIISGEGSFAIRLWSIKHSLNLLFNYPILGMGIGSGGALGGLVTVVSNIGLFGMMFLIYSFKNIFPIRNNGVLFSFYALIIFNVITGDLSTFFSPIFALLLAYSSKITDIDYRNASKINIL